MRYHQLGLLHHDPARSFAGYTLVTPIRHTAVFLVDMDGQEVVGTETLISGFRVRDVRQGPDGYIYVAAGDRDGAPTRIVRLAPTMES